MERNSCVRIKFLYKGRCLDSYANKNANLNSKNCKVISKLLLPEDLMFQIFTMLSPIYLLNSVRYVCKSWAAIIANPLFVEVCQRLGAHSKPGLYVENRKSHISSYFLEFKDDVNDQFERTDLGTPRKMGCLINTCDGILLLSKEESLFVVNPILKCWLRIPRIPIYEHDLVYPDQYHITRVPHTTKFKLFHARILEISGAFWYVFYVLRIGIDSSWKEIIRKEAPRRWYSTWKALYSGGNDLYWITNKEIIFLLDIDKEIIVCEYRLPQILREFPLPPITVNSRTSSILLWKGNCLSCIVTIDSYRTNQIYILDFDSRKWSFYHDMGHFDYVAVCGHNLDPRDVSFRLWINNQIIFQVGLRQNQIGRMSSRKCIHFGYNVKTKQLTKIEDIELGNFKVWLHNNSLVSLPTTPAQLCFLV